MENGARIYADEFWVGFVVINDYCSGTAAGDGLCCVSTEHSLPDECCWHRVGTDNFGQTEWRLKRATSSFGLGQVLYTSRWALAI